MRLDWLVRGVLAGWLLATAASQHPNNMFDRFRRYDRTGVLIPNWRFFAPEPARHDFHVLHRVLTADDEATPWRETRHFTPRRWLHAVWFPDHRRDKAIFDVCHDLIKHLQVPGRDLTHMPAYIVLRDFVESVVRDEYAAAEPPQGFQFTVARYTGHDHDHEPEFILVSPYVPLRAATPAAA